jgi:hypothetical protein
MPIRRVVTTYVVQRILIIAGVVLACGTAALAQPFGVNGDDFPNTTFPEARFGDSHVVMYDDGVLLASAAYRYSQYHHDSQWVVVRLALSASERMSIRREDIVLVRPDGIEVPAASRRDGRRDIEGVRLLLNERQNWRDNAVRFPRRRAGGGYTFEFGVARGTGIATRVVQIDLRTSAVGDVFFVSPDRRWEDGVYALIVPGNDDHVAKLPVILE